jgi:hypothetical protein
VAVGVACRLGLGRDWDRVGVDAARMRWRGWGLCANIAPLLVTTTRSDGEGWGHDRGHRAGRQVGNVMSSEQPGFKVSDQRHFAADGSLRTPESEETMLAVEREPEAETKAASPPAASVEFSSFVLSLAAQANAFLQADKSESADAGRSASPEEEGARQIIAILEMLQDKTEGRRTAEETRLLDRLLFELRMTYVARHQESGR